MSIISVGDLIERAYDEARPLGAQLELTYKCNLLCSFCYNAPQARQELTGEQWALALDKLKAAGTFNITLTGGEPLLHRDFFTIAAAVRERGLVLRTYTNGVRLADRSCAERYAALSPFETELTVHGADAPTHERLTGIRGSFAKVVAALDNLRELGVKVTLKTPITRLNQDQLSAIRGLAETHGCEVVFDTNITPADDGDLGPLTLAPDRDFLVGFFLEEIRRGAKGLGPRLLEQTKHMCGTGRVTLTIDPYGDVFPCVAWRRRIANILEVADLGALWQGAGGALNETLALVRRVAEEAPSRALAAHPGGAFASFCLGAAEKETGDPLAYYPAARISGMTRMQAYEQVQRERERSVGTGVQEKVAPEPGPL